MQFVALIAIVSEELEQKCIEIAKEAGAGGVTITKGSALGLREKKTFFGLTLEDNVSILFFILPKKLSVPVFKKLKTDLSDKNETDDEDVHSAMIMTLPIEHFAGIQMDELELFEDEVQNFL